MRNSGRRYDLCSNVHFRNLKWKYLLYGLCFLAKKENVPTKSGLLWYSTSIWRSGNSNWMYIYLLTYLYINIYSVPVCSILFYYIYCIYIYLLYLSIYLPTYLPKSYLRSIYLPTYLPIYLSYPSIFSNIIYSWIISSYHIYISICISMYIYNVCICLWVQTCFTFATRFGGGATYTHPDAKHLLHAGFSSIKLT